MENLELYKNSKPKIVILGVGNILRSDEGIGVHIVREMENEVWSMEYEDCEIVDGGTLGVDLIPCIENADKLIIVDAIKNGGKPGAVYRMEYGEWNMENEEKKLSLHQIDLIDTLKIMEIQNKLPKEIVIIGIEPKNLDWGEELSGEVKGKIPEIEKMLEKEVIRCLLFN